MTTPTRFLADRLPAVDGGTMELPESFPVHGGMSGRLGNVAKAAFAPINGE
jgi:hypothetical protein